MRLESLNKTSKKVFLGGTCNDSTWRDLLIPKLKIDFFNPVVEDWTEEAYQEELRQKDICDFLLFVITPKMTGVFSIAEVVDCSNKNPEKTIFCVLNKDADSEFSEGQIKSLDKVKEMVETNGGRVCSSLDEVADLLNSL